MFSTTSDAQWRTAFMLILLAGVALGGFFVWEPLATGVDKADRAAIAPSNRATEAAMSGDVSLEIATRLQSVANRDRVGWPSLSTANAEEVKTRDTIKPKEDRFQLVGIMQMGAGKGRALIRTNNDTQGRWISVGDVIQGWQLRRVAEETALMETGGRQMELQLHIDHTAILAQR